MSSPCGMPRSSAASNRRRRSDTPARDWHVREVDSMVTREEPTMEPIVLFGIQFMLSLVAYWLIAFWYVAPRLSGLPPELRTPGPRPGRASRHLASSTAPHREPGGSIGWTSSTLDPRPREQNITTSTRQDPALGALEPYMLKVLSPAPDNRRPRARSSPRCDAGCGCGVRRGVHADSRYSCSSPPSRSRRRIWPD
jgi:hypothetical protein